MSGATVLAGDTGGRSPAGGSVSAGRAARLLGVRKCDIKQAVNNGQLSPAGPAGRVPMAQVEQCQAQPPGWLLKARTKTQRLAARRERRRRQAVARRKQRADDHGLCPPAVAQLLGLSSERVAAAMRAAGVCTPLDKATVRGWLSSCARPMPDWLPALLAQAAAEVAEREAHAQAEAVEAEHRRLLVEERVREKLLAGQRRFHGDDLEVVEEWAFHAAKELLHTGGEVGELETAALRAVGINANDHTTWPFHCGGCDGLGAANCAEIGRAHV